MPDDPPVTQSKAEKLAKDALMLGVASIICGITSLPAIIYSIRALIRIRNDGASKTAFRKAIFSLIFSSCVFGFCVFTIISAFRAAQAMADDMSCMNNMKELALELRIYTGDHDDLFPPASRWCDAIQSTNKASFHCRAAPKKQTCSYAMNRNLDGLKDCAEIEPETVLLFESDAGWNAAGGPEMAATRRHYQMHVAFVNGHVESFNYEDFRKLHWSPYTNSSAVKTK